MTLKTLSRDERLALFNEELELIRLPYIKRWTEDCLAYAPNYFFEMSSSDTGFHHPPWALGPGGLVRHTKAVATLAASLSGTFYPRPPQDDDIEAVPTQNDGVVSAIVSACILHDSCKYGIPFDLRMTDLHPYIPRVYYKKVTGSLDKDELNFIFTMIESHMGSYSDGSWSPIYKNTKNTLTSNPAALIVHMADFMASRDNYVDIRFADINGREEHKEYDPYPDYFIKGIVHAAITEFRSPEEAAVAVTNGNLESIFSRTASLRHPRSVRNSKYNLDGILDAVVESLDLIIPVIKEVDDDVSSSKQETS